VTNVQATLERKIGRENPEWIETLARVGLVAKGISYALVAVLAIKLAAGEGGKATSRSGALRTIADEGFGKFLLVLLAIGFASYAVWRFVEAAFLADHDDGWAKRAGQVARGLLYAGLTYTTVKLVLDAGSEKQSQNQQAKKATAEVLDWPAGRWLVALAGIALIGAGAYNVWRGVAKKFLKHWRENLGERARWWGARIGVVGLVARGIVFGLIGVFFVKAAVEYDPKEAVGLDGALQKLAGSGHGPWLLGLTAAGLLAYGVFCFAEARYRDVTD
jgi:hypothetical protein